MRLIDLIKIYIGIAVIMLTLLVVTSLVTSCGTGRVSLSGRVDTTLDEYPLLVHGTVRNRGPGIKEAVRDWNYALGEDLLTLVPLSAPYADVEVILADLQRNLGHAQPSGDGCLIVLEPQAPYRVVTHELGHCLGVSHSSDRKSIMYYKLLDDHDQDILQSDTDRVWEHYERGDLI